MICDFSWSTSILNQIYVTLKNTSDILVIGAGVAGLTFAIKMAEKRPDLSITVLTKTHEGESNTRYAQGGSTKGNLVAMT